MDCLTCYMIIIFNNKILSLACKWTIYYHGTAMIIIYPITKIITNVNLLSENVFMKILSMFLIDFFNKINLPLSKMIEPFQH